MAFLVCLRFLKLYQNDQTFKNRVSDTYFCSPCWEGKTTFLIGPLRVSDLDAVEGVASTNPQVCKFD